MPGAGAEPAAVAAGGGDAEHSRPLSRSGRSWRWPEAARVSDRALSAESAGVEGRIRGAGTRCGGRRRWVGDDCGRSLFASRAARGFPALDLCRVNYNTN